MAIIIAAGARALNIVPEPVRVQGYSFVQMILGMAKPEGTTIRRLVVPAATKSDIETLKNLLPNPETRQEDEVGRLFGDESFFFEPTRLRTFIAKSGRDTEGDDGENIAKVAVDSVVQTGQEHPLVGYFREIENADDKEAFYKDLLKLQNDLDGNEEARKRSDEIQRLIFFHPQALPLFGMDQRHIDARLNLVDLFAKWPDAKRDVLCRFAVLAREEGFQEIKDVIHWFVSASDQVRENSFSEMSEILTNSIREGGIEYETANWARDLKAVQTKYQLPDESFDFSGTGS